MSDTARPEKWSVEDNARWWILQPECGETSRAHIEALLERLAALSVPPDSWTYTTSPIHPDDPINCPECRRRRAARIALHVQQMAEAQAEEVLAGQGLYRNGANAMTDLQGQVDALVADGWQIVNQGRVLIPFEAKTPKPTFAERVEGFVGVLPGEKLLDDDTRWFQLRRRRD